MFPTTAKTVVYRHPCDCANASRPLGEGEKPEHRFDVDGAPFPWHMTEAGPHFLQLAPQLYAVYVRIIPLLRDADDKGEAAGFSHQGYGMAPWICGRPFPWMISEHGIAYTCSRTELPVLALAFFAEAVDADCDVPGVPPGEHWSFGGEPMSDQARQARRRLLAPLQEAGPVRPTEALQVDVAVQRL